MALKVSNTLKPSNSTAALFRAWSKFVRDGFTEGGWVQTADTGQIDFTTTSAPAGADEKTGYVILRMDDSLQATHPVYVRLDFGSGSAAANISIWVTVGTGSNGSGTITGAWITDRRSSLGGSSTATTPFYSHVSAGTSYAAVALFYPDSSGSHCLHFSMERAKDSSGDDDGTGFMLNGTGPGTVFMTQYATVDNGTTHLASGSPYVVSLDSQSRRSDVGIGVVLPYRYINGFERASPPGLGHILLKISDWNFGAVVTVYMYGRAHRYIRLTNNSLANIRGDTPGTHAVAIRYDD